MNACDKCGAPVEPSNNAVLIDVTILAMNGWELDALVLQDTARPRHLLPVEGCEGSPSRAQYVEGQPRDPRPEYAWDEAIAERVRAAYAVVVTL